MADQVPDRAPEHDLKWHLRRFPLTLGAALVAPRRALAEVDVAEAGGMSAAIGWALAAGIALRFTALADAIVGFEAGGLVRVLSIVTSDMVQAVPAVVVAALVVVVCAGARRDPWRDLELGAVAALPYLIVHAIVRAFELVRGTSLSSVGVRATSLVGVGWSLILLILAIRTARLRPGRRPDVGGPPERWRIRVAGWTAIGALVAGLGGGAHWTWRHADALGPVTRGRSAPDFVLPRADTAAAGEGAGTGERTLALGSLRGKVVLLDFWATWCPPCLAMIPTLHELEREFGPRGVAFVGINSDGADARADVAEFLRQHPSPYPIVYDDGSANQSYRVRVLPTVVIVGRDGSVTRVLIGSASKKSLADALSEALQ